MEPGKYENIRPWPQAVIIKKVCHSKGDIGGSIHLVQVTYFEDESESCQVLASDLEF